jgi:hypothetical protein
MDTEETKYSRSEYERRFLIAPGTEWKSFVESYSKTYEDTYLRGTRLRLRILTDSDTDPERAEITQRKRTFSDRLLA